ncbi:hypothetical protein GX50_04151 [[Emmonsia] crescens]|uniref:Uncharacterized protein n=1 Tax=[Emmonsia] crescens TaxID=73230 RepID=A0A2B7ZJS4_9EURO|nr:hypothetical protein GX50_04151 [Emmonsia crescens]
MQNIPSLQYYAAVRRFCLSVYEQESRRYKLPLKDLPLTNLWRPHAIESLLIAHGLSNPHYFGNVYCDALDQLYYGENPEERMQAFFRIRKNQLHIVEQKILEFAEFEKE